MICFLPPSPLLLPHCIKNIFYFNFFSMQQVDQKRILAKVYVTYEQHAFTLCWYYCIMTIFLYFQIDVCFHLHIMFSLIRPSIYTQPCKRNVMLIYDIQCQWMWKLNSIYANIFFEYLYAIVIYRVQIKCSRKWIGFLLGIFVNIGTCRKYIGIMSI